MANLMYAQFQKVQNQNINGKILADYWCLNIWDKYNTHTFAYESFEEMKEDWQPEKVIGNLKHYEVLEDFLDVLKHQKGFYYPSEGNLNTWIEIEKNELED
ncbi:hypothetical protein BIV60_15405 [Bacillus sp. MUM 116]|uniref:hypothetical protein n=1 Tax=Bacillus sp. MUM 116 TaxID=1678002 RepID=UPI0008F57CB8|nr:hypothetical protein [Bacillus sp. MUM 116]OIK12909.1 hypothetical protein BIV60_15405 [Bacillus sp. MUM 116]